MSLIVIFIKKLEILSKISKITVKFILKGLE